MAWRREWQPTPVFMPGESHGQRSLSGYSPWSWKELDMTEQLSMFTQRPYGLGKGVATHSSILASRILWTEEPGRLQPMQSQRVGNDWRDLAQCPYGLPLWLRGKSVCNAGDVGLISGSGRSLEKEMATNSSISVWEIPWTEEPGRLESRGSQGWTGLND